MSASRPARRFEAVPLAEIRARLAAVPAWGWLVALVGLSAGLRFALALRLPGPWIFPDEVRYAELARGVATSGRFEIGGVEFRGFGLVYPILIAPAYALFDDPVRAYTAVKAINAVLVSLTAVPTYLLARRFVSQHLALGAAALALLVPSAAYSSVVMTENAFYPIFMCVTLALVLTLERPTAIRQVVLIALAVVAYLTRPQALVVAPAFVCAVALLATVAASGSPTGQRLRAFARSVWSFRVTWLCAAAGIVAYAAVKVVRGGSLRDIVGSYPTIASTDYSFGQVARLFVDNLAGFDIAVGIVPFAALGVLMVDAVRTRGLDRARLALAAASLFLVLWLTLLAAAFASRAAVFRVEERYVFYASPLLFVVFAVWIAAGRVRPGWAEIACAAVASLLPAVLLRSDFLDFRNVPDSLSLWPVVRLVEAGLSVGQVGLVLLGLSCAAGVLFVLLPGRWRPALALVIAVFFVAAGAHVSNRMEHLSSSELAAGIRGDRSWIDDRVPEGATVVSIWSPAKTAVNWENEFFSSRIGKGLDFGSAPGWDSVPEIAVRLDRGTGILLDAEGQPVSAEYVVADTEYQLAGDALAVDPLIGTTLYRFDGPVRLREQLSGVYADGFSAPAVGYLRPDCLGGSLEMTLFAPSGLFAAPPTIAASGANREELTRAAIPLDTEFPFVVPLQPVDGLCAATFAISPSVVPETVYANGDYRELGVRFDEIEFVPSP